MHHKLTSIIGIALLLATALAASAAPIIGSKGYRLDPPAGWIAKANYEGADLLLVDPIPSTLPPSISLNITQTVHSDPKKQLQKLVSDTVSSMAASVDNFKLIETSDTTLGRGPAKEFLVSFDPQGAGCTARMHEYVCIHNDQQYEINITVDEAVFPAMDQVFATLLKSFTFGDLGGQPYISPDGYQIMPPAGWTVNPSDTQHHVYFVQQGSKDFAANMCVSVTAGLPPSYTAERFYAERDEMNRNQYPAADGFSILQQSIVTVAGTHAVETLVESPSSDGKQKLWMRHLMIPHNGSLVEVMAMSLTSDRAKLEPVFDAAVQTLAWTDLGNATQ